MNRDVRFYAINLHGRQLIRGATTMHEALTLVVDNPDHYWKLYPPTRIVRETRETIWEAQKISCTDAG